MRVGSFYAQAVDTPLGWHVLLFQGTYAWQPHGAARHLVLHLIDFWLLCIDQCQPYVSSTSHQTRVKCFLKRCLLQNLTGPSLPVAATLVRHEAIRSGSVCFRFSRSERPSSVGSVDDKNSNSDEDVNWELVLRIISS